MSPQQYRKLSQQRRQTFPGKDDISISQKNSLAVDNKQ